MMDKEEIKKMMVINDEMGVYNKLNELRDNNPRYRGIYNRLAKECVNEYNYHMLTDIYNRTKIEMSLINKGVFSKNLSKEEIVKKYEETGVSYGDGTYNSMEREDVLKLYHERLLDLDRTIMKNVLVATYANIGETAKRRDHDERCKMEYCNLSDILHDFSKSEDEELRTLYAGHCSIDMLEYMKDDPSDRVKKVIFYRTNFEELWNDKYFFDEKKREKILFFEEAFKNGDIEIMDTKVGLYQPEAMRIKVSSQYFEPFLCDIDQDLVKSISDKRILASYLEKYMSYDVKMDIASVIKNAKQDDIEVIGIDDELSASDALDSVLEQELGYVPDKVTQNMGMANLLSDIKQQKTEEANTLLADVSLPTKKENESLIDAPKHEPTLEEKVVNLEKQVSTLSNELKAQQEIIKQQNEMLKELVSYVKLLQPSKEETETYKPNEDENNKSK